MKTIFLIVFLSFLVSQQSYSRESQGSVESDREETDYKTYICAYEGPYGVEETLQARIIVKESELEFIRDTGRSFVYTILFNKKRILLAARPVYQKKRGRLINPGVDTLSIRVPSRREARRGVRTEIKLGRVIQSLPDSESVDASDSVSLGTCM